MTRPGLVPWATLAVALATGPVFAADGPLTISHGGTYRGDWASDDVNTPVVRIRTREPVVVEHSTLTGRGMLVDGEGGDANVTLRDVHGVSLNPNVAGRCAGRFFSGDEVARLVIEHCRLDGTAGIFVHKTADKTDAEITVRCNDVRNIDGRFSDGHDGYLAFNRRIRSDDHRVEEGCDLVQFLQLDQVVGLAHGEIAWNRVVNEPGRSRVEDNISIYETSGVAGSPIRVHDNCIVGAYTIDPSRPSGTRDGWHEDWDYSGGGIMLGDGPGKSLETASGFIVAENNVVLSTGNYGIGVAGGHDIRVVGNRVFGSGMLADGRKVLTQNVGIYVWDIAKGKKRQPPTCFAVSGSGNVVGWWNAEKATRNDWWNPDVTQWENNAHANGPITAAVEATEARQWQIRSVEQHQLIGVVR